MGAVETRRAHVSTCALHGVQAVPVSVEIEIGGGLPGWHIVGMVGAAVQEARLRVRSAVRAAGFEAPAKHHVVVNLAPASMKKNGSGFDLPIAIAYLVATGQVSPKLVTNAIIVGELSLEGSVRPVDGLFAYAVCAQQNGMCLLSALPGMRLPELKGLKHFCIDHLACLRSAHFLDPEDGPLPQQPHTLDFADVVGQDIAVRALTIAAAGEHGVMLVGPPGSGKSMLARRMPSILPELTDTERIESALIHSVAGLDVTSVTAGVRPFRSPHHSASLAALVGGGPGTHLVPGEVSLAHNGTLFLDELALFSNAALQALRQPMEDGQVLLSRADGRTVFPARFQLLAASNPCPCGYLGDRAKSCSCTEVQISQYRTKLGGPLKDRIDLICEVSRIDPAKVMESGHGMASSRLADMVLAARERASARGPRLPIAAATPHKVIEACALKDTQRKLIENLARAHDLSGRGIIRVLRVARTIADLEGCDEVCDDHIYESYMYRVENALIDA